MGFPAPPVILDPLKVQINELPLPRQLTVSCPWCTKAPSLINWFDALNKINLKKLPFSHRSSLSTGRTLISPFPLPVPFDGGEW